MKWEIDHHSTLQRRKAFSLCPISLYPSHVPSIPLLCPSHISSTAPPPPVCFYFSSPPVKWDLKTKFDFFFLDPLLLFSCRFSFHNSILSQHDHHFTSITVFMTRQAFLSISTSTSSATPLEAGSQISTADKDGQFKAKCSNGLSPLIVHPDAYYFTQLCYGGFDTQRL